MGGASSGLEAPGMKQQDLGPAFGRVSVLLREAQSFDQPVTGSYIVKEDPKPTLVYTKMTQRMGNPAVE